VGEIRPLTPAANLVDKQENTQAATKKNNPNTPTVVAAFSPQKKSPLCFYSTGG